MNLANCRFCGGEARRTKSEITTFAPNGRIVTVSTRYRITCSNCGSSTAWAFYEDDAANLWNGKLRKEEYSD